MYNALIGRLVTLLIWSALAGLVSVSIYFIVNETDTELSFTSGMAVGGVLAGTGAYLKKQRRPK